MMGYHIFSTEVEVLKYFVRVEEDGKKRVLPISSLLYGGLTVPKGAKKYRVTYSTKGKPNVLFKGYYVTKVSGRGYGHDTATCWAPWLLGSTDGLPMRRSVRVLE